jgi:hypothetical protein
MPTFPPLGVVAVVLNDPAVDSVVVGVHRGHHASVGVAGSSRPRTTRYAPTGVNPAPGPPLAFTSSLIALLDTMWGEGGK